MDTPRKPQTQIRLKTKTKSVVHLASLLPLSYDRAAWQSAGCLSFAYSASLSQHLPWLCLPYTISLHSVIPSPLFTPFSLPTQPIAISRNHETTSCPSLFSRKKSTSKGKSKNKKLETQSDDEECSLLSNINFQVPHKMSMRVSTLCVSQFSKQTSQKVDNFLAEKNKNSRTFIGD